MDKQNALIAAVLTGKLRPEDLQVQNDELTYDVDVANIVEPILEEQSRMEDPFGINSELEAIATPEIFEPEMMEGLFSF